MSVPLVSLLAYPVLILFGIYYWKKYNDPSIPWYLFPVIGLLVLTVSQWFLGTNFNLSEDDQAIEFLIFTALRVLMGGTLLIVFLINFFKKK